MDVLFRATQLTLLINGKCNSCPYSQLAALPARALMPRIVAGAPVDGRPDSARMKSDCFKCRHAMHASCSAPFDEE